MIETSDEVDLKPSLRGCSRGRDFISVSNAFLVIETRFERAQMTQQIVRSKDA